MEFVTSNDGTRIAFDRTGAGPSVILVGGAFQHRAIDPQTAKLASLLGQRFTVVHYDRRGRGDSGDTLPYSVDREVEDLAALIQQVGGQAYVFGMSSGGALVLRATASGLAIRKLALYEPPFNLQEGARAAANGYNTQLKSLLAEGRRGDAVALAMTTFGAPAEAVAGMRQAPIWPIFESVAPTLAYDSAIMGDGSIPTQLVASVTAPALVMDGGASPDWVREAAHELVHTLPNARLRTLEGQTHEVAPDVLAPELTDFFEL